MRGWFRFEMFSVKGENWVVQPLLIACHFVWRKVNAMSHALNILLAQLYGNPYSWGKKTLVFCNVRQHFPQISPSVH
jgi:hypothetical protein